ncbi:MAG: hypothetical protein J2P57_15440 [Acidimicrobiaceae bacterium]|nr:hypothetical protein [Acidimicrobiaceae bacterium]
MAREVAVVAHTHWDREWYAPFPAFRARLVELLDVLIDVLEGDEGFTRFLLDGQMAVIDDYLEVRPEAAPALQRLAATGQLAMGPWYVLMDEFGVSGETIIRNLQLGLARAERFGGAMAVGYLPDMFGHIAQMPQLLRLAGFDHAVVWRGVPGAVDRAAFWWSAPDGSRVRAEYLPVGYANGAHLPLSVDDFLRRVAAIEAESASFLPAGDPLLLMAGTDHQFPQAGLPALLAKTNESQDDFAFTMRSLPEYLASAPVDGLPEWTGELRSGARANLLMGVASNRVDVKVAAARAERSLERWAEPLAALWEPGAEQGLSEAWLEVIRNSAHDTICACSADEVGLAALHRYANATTIAGTVAREALEVASLAFSVSGPVVVNPTGVTRSGVVTVVLPAGVEVPALSQVLREVAPTRLSREGVGADLGQILAELTREGWMAYGRATTAQVAAGPDGVAFNMTFDRTARPSLETPAVRAEAYAQAGAHRNDRLQVTLDVAGWREVAVVARDVPGFGWRALSSSSEAPPPVTAGDTWLDNGLVRVAVDTTDGSFSLADAGSGLSAPRLGQLVDGGDAGDTYNYSPPDLDTIVSAPQTVAVSCEAAGPVIGRLVIARSYVWPPALDGDKRGDSSRPVSVRTSIELRAGERLVRMETSFDNPSRDHRLRAHFPLPRPATSSVAECAFGTVRRGLTAEGGPGERGLPTFPSRRWVAAGGLTLTHEGLLEYELIDGGATLALTLLRATGMLSRPAPAYRHNSAGPPHAIEGPQLVGPIRARYAVALGDDLDGYRLADDAWSPLEVVPATGGGALAPVGTHLDVSGAEISSLRWTEGALELRVFNPSDEPTVVQVPGRSGWLVDLRGEGRSRWSDSWPLGPRAIATARIDP